MLSGQSLVVTAAPSDRITSLNNVKITGSPLYDNGFLLVYGIDRFFDPNFQDNSPNQKPNPIPPDEMVLSRIGEFDEYPSFFLRHVVRCKLLWNDLVNFDGSLLPTFLKGFMINITRSSGVLMLNGVTVFFPDIFCNDKVVVHGVSDVLASQDKSIEAVESLSR